MNWVHGWLGDSVRCAHGELERGGDRRSDPVRAAAALGRGRDAGVLEAAGQRALGALA